MTSSEGSREDSGNSHLTFSFPRLSSSFLACLWVIDVQAHAAHCGIANVAYLGQIDHDLDQIDQIYHDRENLVLHVPL